jgi:TctA family transporter
MIPFGYLAVKTSSQMLRVPKSILMPAILMFAVTGSFAINNSVFDIGVLGIMGVVGYFMEKNEYPIAPIVLGLVLGPILEQNFMISMIKSEWDLTLFFVRPISAILGTLTLIVWFFPLLAAFLERGKKNTPMAQ